MSPDAAWTLEPGPIVVVLVPLVLYLTRWRTVRREHGPREAPTIRLICFLLGIACLFAALVSPIDRLGEQIFVMHMTQHLLLLDLAPVLMLLGLTKVILRPITRRVHRLEQKAGVLAHPAVAVVVYAGTMAVWHIPALYDNAVEYPLIHVTEHLTFAFAGGLYWWHLLSPIRSRMRLGGLGPIVYMAASKGAVGLIGIALTFSPDPIYDFYEEQPDYWGLTAGDDQAVGGLVMALEQTVLMGTVLVWLVSTMLAESERTAKREDREADLALEDADD